MGTGEAHRGTLRKVTIWGIYGELEITARLSQVLCRWPTDVYVDLDVRGLHHEYQVAQGTAAFPVDRLAAITRMLTDLAATGPDWATRPERRHPRRERRTRPSSHGEEADR
jgi:hypothetical protein